MLQYLPIRFQGLEQHDHQRCYLYPLLGELYQGYPNLGLLVLELDETGGILSAHCRETPIVGRRGRRHWLASLKGQRKNPIVIAIGTHTAYSLLQNMSDRLTESAAYSLSTTIYISWYANQPIKWHLRLGAILAPSGTIYGKALRGLKGTPVLLRAAKLFSQFQNTRIRPLTSRTGLRRLLSTDMVSLPVLLRTALQLIPFPLSKGYLLWRQTKAIQWFAAVVAYQVQEPTPFQIVIKIMGASSDIKRFFKKQLEATAKQLSMPSNVFLGMLTDRSERKEGSLPYYETVYKVQRA
jgi:hypothetical protein